MPSAPPASEPACHVHKFGGSSLADAHRILSLPPLVADGAASTVVVVSAMHGTTNALVAMADDALARRDWREAWQALRTRHLDTAAAIAAGNVALHDALVADFDALREDLEALAAGDADDARIARVHGLGEIASSRLVQATLGEDWARLDARDVLVVHPGEMGVGVEWEASRAKLAAWRDVHPSVRIVATGFIARGRDGADTTLGRNGSDYSAAILANASAEAAHQA
jgi:bifunctional aspartokinase / homoserine dehydrogenase 1